jgi:acetyl-CoA carboxylase, biotin carboxylase subunit
MRAVAEESELESAMRGASGEAERSFGSSEVYLEKLVERPRHIEVQILGDEHGHLIHLGERECSIQRRHQKVVEESPSPLVTAHPHLRDSIGEAALKIARSVGYYGAGTLEFLATRDGQFYFLEMNTRLQVEHPITEWVTSVDIVRWQLRIAAGEHLNLKQEDVELRGSAIECRVYAEDPANSFFPCPGKIVHYAEPSGPGVRVDSGVYPGWNVPLDYDPLIAKLSVWAATREESIDRMRRAIEEFQITGITTNLSLYARLLDDPGFRHGDLHTGFLDQFMPGFLATEQAPEPGGLTAALLAAAKAEQQVAALHTLPPAAAASNAWKTNGRREMLR